MAQCQRLRPGEAYSGKQGFDYLEGISRETTGASGICMHMLTIRPGDRAKARLHEAHETAIYVISGRARMHHGPDLGEVMEIAAGDLIYIPAGVPHLPLNPYDADAVAVLARTDPNEQESVVLRPDLEDRVPA